MVLAAGCATTQPVQPLGSAPATAAPATAVSTSGAASPDPALVAKRAALGIAPCPASGAAGGSGAAADGLPAVTTACLDGSGPVDLAALRGTPMVVNLWATWCGPCRTEAPFLAEVSKESATTVRFIGVDVADPDPAAALDFAGAQRWSYAQVADPDRRFSSQLGVVGIPQTVLVDASGRIVYRHAGALTSADQLRGLLRDHLGTS
ncbi:redoxin family protein [Raineyella fluvialis]|uniref:Redoxin family protein n=2 Tax=Raineyella fluvialis TaxID=2662261 RepID=A0A5Q2FL33_9ACTN|nr:redoxin family protein [Raineyella fluvialis]